jgi:hypothetical protein
LHSYWTVFLARGRQDTSSNLCRCIPDRESLLLYLTFVNPPYYQLRNMNTLSKKLRKCELRKRVTNDSRYRAAHHEPRESGATDA